MGTGNAALISVCVRCQRESGKGLDTLPAQKMPSAPQITMAAVSSVIAFCKDSLLFHGQLYTKREKNYM